MKTTKATRKGPAAKARRAQLEQSIRHGGGDYHDIRELLTRLVRNPLGVARHEAAELLGLTHLDAAGDREAFMELREAARAKFEREGRIEFDDDCPVSIGQNGKEDGAYVQAWIYVERL